MASSAALSAQFVAGKATRDALFLANAEVSALPAAVVATALVSIGLVALSSVLFRRRSPEVLVPAAFAISSAGFLIDWLLVRWMPVPVAWLVYLQVSGWGPLLGSGFWLLVSERFDPRTARRHFAQIAGVGTLAGLAGAIIAERVGAVFGVTAMLPVLALLNAACAIALRQFEPIRTGGPEGRTAMDAAPELMAESPQSGLRAIAGAPYLVNLAALVFLGTVGAALADYVFKAAAVESFGSGDTLLRFFAVYYAGVSVLSFVLQATVSSVALDKLGLALTASTPSLALALAGLGSLVFPGLEGAMVARGSESIFRGSLFKTGYEIFFTPVAPHEKRAAKGIIDIGCDRLGDGVGGAMIPLLLMVPLGTASHRLLLVAVSCSLAAVWAAQRLSHGYIAALEKSLVNRALDLELSEIADWTTRTSVMKTLRSQLPGTIRSVSEEANRTAVASLSVADPEVQEILALRSRDEHRVRAVLQEGDGLPASLVAHAIPLLAWDPVAEDVVRALRAVAEERVGELTDALIDPNQPFGVRRRLARVFSVCVSQRAADALMLGLEDLRFEVRFHCGRSLAAILERNPGVRIDRDRVFDLVRREVAVGRPVWESERLLDDVDGNGFGDEFLKRRAGQSLGHVFTLLSLVLPAIPLQIAYRGLHTDDLGLRGTALEYLEGVLPHDIRDRLWPYLGDDPARRPGPVRDRDQILADLMRSNDSIMLNLQELRHRLSAPPAERGA